MRFTLILIPVIVISTYLYMSERDAYMARGFATSTAPADKTMLLKYYNNLINNPLADPYYKFRASLLLSDAGYSAESYTEIQKLILTDPVNLDYLKAIAYFASQRGDTNIATKARLEIVKNDPWNAINYNELGTLYYEIGKKDEARKMFQKDLDFAPNTDQAKLAKLSLDKL